jgi:DNA polymerase-3 subunit chi
MPPRIDFYLLKDETLQATWSTACRLLEKAYHFKHSVFVLCSSKEDAEFLDELLWTFKDDSFIPHHLQGEGPEPPPPIQIGLNEPSGFNDILLNLSPLIPSFFQRFRRIIEIVPNQESAKEISRQHYRDYKTKGCILQTHSIEPKKSS